MRFFLERSDASLLDGVAKYLSIAKSLGHKMKGTRREMHKLLDSLGHKLLNTFPTKF